MDRTLASYFMKIPTKGACGLGDCMYLIHPIRLRTDREIDRIFNKTALRGNTFPGEAVWVPPYTYLSLYLHASSLLLLPLRQPTIGTVSAGDAPPLPYII